MVQRLRGTLGDAMMPGSLYLYARPPGIPIALEPVVVPSPGGAIVGGIGVVCSRNAHHYFQAFEHQGKVNVRHWGGQSDVNVLVCLSTYLDDALITPEQRRVVADRAERADAPGRRGARLPPARANARIGRPLPFAASGYGKDMDKRIHAGFRPLGRRVNGLFPHWRKRIAECDYTDAEMAEIAARYPHGWRVPGSSPTRLGCRITACSASSEVGRTTKDKPADISMETAAL
ncbi:hypothetical protein [Azospirillum soli]|uniref:hypothetical protein n=1 Tax=Azospirillum soli TaxID=1304799 RepID=UPI001AE8153B|nr:hypothetical protein [Azospirillum soli]MBP2315453.1 hypothetical protein [Azospirillum soli]